MQLSPRVIVVWFQNARQKARKIYENTPHGAGGGTAGDPTSDRFVKTPGCNYQCRRCALVFQRYYELIQHQQKHCYKDDGAAQQSDNAKCGLAVSEGEDDEEEDEMMLGNDDDDDTASKTFSTSESPSPSSKASTPAIRPPVAGARRRKDFNKRCPFCGILFYSKESLLTHLPKRHPEQLQRTMVNIDALPDAEEVLLFHLVYNYHHFLSDSND
jgi:AT-binding transcription factor 1